MIFEVSHRTRYEYDDVVTASYAEVHQLPQSVDGQTCLRRSVAVDPEPEHYRERHDYFGNLAAVVAIHEPHTVLTVTSTSVIDTAGRPETFGPAGERRWEAVSDEARTDLDALEFILDSPLVASSGRLAAYAEPSFHADRAIADAVGELTHRVHTDFTFDTSATEVDTPLEAVFDLRRGVCQDFAHVLIGALRSVGLAACYVSGYLETVPPPGRPRLAGVDRTHAWVGVYLGRDTWIGIDPTNDQTAGASYITAARGRDYADVPPLKGVIYTDAEESALTVAVDVGPRSEDDPVLQ